MSNKVDQRIVEMRFENSQFEKGVSQSIKSIDKLKSSLNFNTNTTKSSLDSISSNLTSLGTSVDNISEKFSTMGIMATTHLVNISNKIFELGQTIIHNLLNNITAGYNRYTEMMESVQTIMYATRNEWEDQEAQMDYVTEQIGRLNWYTDETSYNLNDMTSSVGKFIAAGIPLEDSVSAMEGIASWAAISGQNAEAASRAMYNLSQAMAMGKLTNLDWKSIENANMATKEFKENAIEAAVEAGTLTRVFVEEWGDTAVYYTGKLKETQDATEGVLVTAENFRNTLQYGWLDKDVLTDVLKKYGDFSVQLGNAVNDTGATATEFLKYLTDYKQAMSEGQDSETWVAKLASKEHIDNVEALQYYLEMLSDEYYALGEAAFRAGQESKTFKDSMDATADAVATAWMNVFQEIFGNYLKSKELWTQVTEIMYETMVEPVQDLGDKLALLNRLGGFDLLKESLLNFWNVFKNIKDAISEGFANIFPDDSAVKKLLYFFQDLKKFSEDISFKNWSVDSYWTRGGAVSDFEVLSDAAEHLARALNRLMIDFSVIGNAIKKAWERIFPPKDVSKSTSKIIDNIHDVAESIDDLSSHFVLTTEQGEKLERFFAGLFAVLDIGRLLLLAIIKPFQSINAEVSGFNEAIFDGAASLGDWLVALRDWIEETGFFDTVVNNVIDFFKKLPVYADQATQALFGMSLEEFLDNIAEKAGLAIGAIILFFTELPENAQKAFEDLTGEKDFLTWWDKLKEKVSEAWDNLQEFFDNFPEKMDELSIALFGEDWNTVWATIQTEVYNTWQDIAKFFGWIEEYDEKGFKKNSPFERMLQDLEDAWDKFMEKVDELEGKLKPVGDWIIDNFLSEEAMAEGKNVLKWAGIIGAIAAILFLGWKLISSASQLANTVKDIKGVSDSKDSLMGKIKNLLGPYAWAKDFAEEATATMGNVKKLVKGGYFALMGLLVLELAVSLFLISKALADNPGATIGAFFLVLVSFAVVMGAAIAMLTKYSAEDIEKLGIYFALAGAVFLEIAGALWIISKIGPDKLIPGVVALGSLFLVLSIAMAYFLGSSWNSGNLMQVAESFVIMAVAMIGLAAALKIISTIDPSLIEGACIAIAALMGILVVAAAAASYIPGFDAGIKDLAIGFIAIAASILILSAAFWVGAAAFNLIVDGIIKLHDAFKKTDEVDPEVLGNKVGNSFKGAAKGVKDSKDDIIFTIVNLGQALIDAFKTLAPQLLEAVQLWIEGIVDVLTNVWPKIETFLLMAGDTALKILEQLVTRLMQLLVDVTPLFIEHVKLITEGLFEILEEFGPRLIDLTLDLTISLLQNILDHIGEIVSLSVQIGIEIVLGFIDGLTQKIPDIIDTGIEFVLGLINGIADGIEKHAQEIRDAMDNFKESMVNSARIVLGIDGNTTNERGPFFTIAVDMLKNFICGITSGIGDVCNAVKEVINAAIDTAKGKDALDEHSPSKSFEEMGEYADEGLANGLSNAVGQVRDAAKDVGQQALDGLATIGSQIKNRIDTIIDGFETPTITPVLDLDEVVSGFQEIGGMFNEIQSSVDMAGGIGFDMNMNKAGENNLLNTLSSSLSNGSNNPVPSKIQNNTFNITGDDPKAIAEEVSNILQTDVERDEAIWGDTTPEIRL